MSDLDGALQIDREKLAQHYKEVESFQSARARSIQRLSKVAVIVAGVALAGNLAQAWTIAAMMPLTRIQPVYLWVRADGTIDSSISVSRLPATQSEAVIDASLWEYARLRESYSFDTAQYAYDIVSAYSSPKVRDEYQSFFNYPNPASPQVTVGKHGVVTVTHISSSNISPTVQQIRYNRVVELEGRRPVATSWTATIGYATVRSLPAGSRLANPGGVLVTSYQAAEDSP